MSVEQMGAVRERKAPPRLGATAFVLLLLDSCEKAKLNEEVLHSLAYLVQAQMPPECYPKMRWRMRANFIYSEEIARSLRLAREQDLVLPAPSVGLTKRGRRHCELLEVPVCHCRFTLLEAAVGTVGLARNNLHLLCMAAAALASGLAAEATVPEVRKIICRHSRYVTQKGKI